MPMCHTFSLASVQGKMLDLLEEDIQKGYNFVVITGNPRVGAPRGCKDALDEVLNHLDAQGKACTGFVFTPCSSVHLEGPSLRLTTHERTLPHEVIIHAPCGDPLDARVSTILCCCSVIMPELA